MPATRIIIGRDGKITIEGVGYIGEQCLLDLQRLIETLKLLGVEIKIEHLQKKPEAEISTTEAEHHEV